MTPEHCGEGSIAYNPDPSTHHPVLSPCKTRKPSALALGVCGDWGEQVWLQPQGLYL